MPNRRLGSHPQIESRPCVTLLRYWCSVTHRASMDQYVPVRRCLPCQRSFPIVQLNPKPANYVRTYFGWKPAVLRKIRRRARWPRIVDAMRKTFLLEPPRCCQHCLTEGFVHNVIAIQQHCLGAPELVKHVNMQGEA